jgi:flagellar motor switch protein FliM
MTRDQSTIASTGDTSKGWTFGALGSGKEQFRVVRGMHQAYARALATTLSAFLGTDIQAELVQVATVKAGSFVASLSSPSCLMMFRLRPLPDQMFLHMDCATVFPLLELLLGGKSDTLSDVTQRHLTEVEWSLLEEIVKVMVRPLGEAWKSVASVEFEVDSLVSEPGLLPVISGAHSFLHLTFELGVGKGVGKLQIVVPESFFDAVEFAGERPDRATGEPGLSHLQNAMVDMEVLLEGPCVALRDLMALQVNWVLQLDHALDRPLRAVLNDQLALEGRIVSVGRKRGFCITALPEA